MNAARDKTLAAPVDRAKPVRWGIYLLLITVAVGSAASRIFHNYDPTRPHPFHSANDRSRWATVRSLVENKTYEIDEIIAVPGWDTIDKVQHANRHGVERFYSSKPPLLATMAAGVYWPIYHSEEVKEWIGLGDSGASDSEGSHEPDDGDSSDGDLSDGPPSPSLTDGATAANPTGGGDFEITPVRQEVGDASDDDGDGDIAHADDDDGDTSEHPYSLASHPHDVSQVILVFTNLIPFFIYLLVIAKFAERYGKSIWGRMFVVATAAFGTYITTFATVLNNHLPAAAASAIAIYATCRIWIDGETRLRYFALAGLFAALAAAMELPAAALLGVLGLLCLLRAPVRTLAVGLPAAAIVITGYGFANHAASMEPWEIPYMHRSLDRDAPDNWYAWEGSTWYDDSEEGFDGNPERDTRKYAMHATAGHHGLLSHTPVWIMSALGLLIILFTGPGGRWRTLGLLLAAVIAAVLAFYLLYVPWQYRNYGGTSAGFRWTHWLTPAFLVLLLPAADLFGKSRLLRFLALLLLLASVFSAVYNAENPWSHPWMVDWMVATGQLDPKLAL